MQYRSFGRSGIKVSAIGCGGHREGVEMRDGLARTARFFTSTSDRARIVAQAIDCGINYFDSTFGCELESLGESLRIVGYRDRVFCSAMRVDFFANYLREKGDIKAYLRREVEDRLRQFGFDSVDQFMLGAMEQGDPLSHPPALLDDCFAEFDHLRAQGKVRLIGFSCHNPDYAARLLLAFPRFDSAMVPYNYVNRAAEGNLAAAIRQTGTALIAMKTLVWHVYGLPVTLLRKLPPGQLPIDPTIPIARLAHQFVLANPQLSTCVPAMNDLPSVHENVSAADAPPLTPHELQHLSTLADAASADNCLPLAIAGLHDTNLRILANAIALAGRHLNHPIPHIDYLSPEAPHQARNVANRLLDQLGSRPHWLACVSESADRC